MITGADRTVTLGLFSVILQNAAQFHKVKGNYFVLKQHQDTDKDVLKHLSLLKCSTIVFFCQSC